MAKATPLVQETQKFLPKVGEIYVHSSRGETKYLVEAIAAECDTSDNFAVLRNLETNVVWIKNTDKFIDPDTKFKRIA